LITIKTRRATRPKGDVSFRPVTSTFDLLTPEVRRFMPLPLRQFAAKSVYPFLKYYVHNFGNRQTNEQMYGWTDKQTSRKHYVCGQSRPAEA